ncbi:MAG TPA: hypothetical protein VMS60_03205 [Solirubrobacterales bacterium]|nr:hypothetical protein [Solirubrobacterales bacterium]
MAQSQPQYSIAFNEHPVHESLKQLKDQVAGLSDELLRAAQDHDPQSALVRLETVLEYIGALLASADPALVTSQMLDNLDAPVQQISSFLTPLKDNKDFAQIPNVQAGFETLLNTAVQLAPAIGVWAKTDEKKAAALLGEASSAKTRQLQEQAGDIQGQLDQLRTQISETSDSMKTTAEERAKELEDQFGTLKAEAEAERARVQKTIDGIESQFQSEQETRSAQFEEAKKALTDQTELVIQESKEAAAKSLESEEERADKVIADLHERSSEVVNFLAEKKQEAIAMVDVEATSSTAGAFKKEAEEQKHEADLWRLLALGLGGFAVLVALVAVVLVVEGVADGNSFIFAKIAAITLLLGIAGYAAGQSGQHRHREKRARRLYLELVAFKPFSEPLPEPERHAVRKEFIERLFVGDPGAEGEDHKDDDVKLSDENLSVLLKFMDMVRSSR